MKTNIRVSNYEEYLDRMKRGLTLQEKLFFVNRINLTQYDCIVDFGGADGSLLNEIAPLTDAKLICVDNQFENRTVARIDYYTTAAEALSVVANKNYCIILSSVLHEVQMDSTLIDLIAGAATIVVRDMYWDETIGDEKHADEIRAIKHQMPAEYANYPTNTLSDCYQLLLKYEYTKNWKIETAEDYFCNHAAFLVDNLAGFNVLYRCTYILPYKYNKVYRDFGIIMKYPTHIQAILQKE